jgi:IS5 family transposase
MQSFMTLGVKKKLRSEKFLEEMDKVIMWNELLKIVNKHYEKEGNIGRNKYDSKLMMKIYFLQQWYNLSDPAMEDAIYDRLSFQKYLEIDLLGDNIPDETTILNFRHFLEKYSLPKKILEIINKALEKKGLLMKEGTIVDASIIIAPSSTKNKTKTRDPEMKSTKKGSNYYFGMKTHIGVDGKSGLVHSVETTSANVHDKDKLNELLHGEEKYVSGDKGYFDQNMKSKWRKEQKMWFVLDRAKRGSKLSNKQKKRNKKLSSIRAKVEHPFHIVKHLWGHTKVRYKGLLKNTMQFYTLFALANLYRVRTNPLLT